MTPAELSSLVSSGEIDTVIVAFTDPYGRLMGKRFDADFFVETGWDDGTHACDYLFTVDMEMAPVPSYTFTNWQTGYGDIHLLPDPSTLRPAGWTQNAALVLCDVVDATTDEPVSVAPRSILRRQVERLADLGLVAMAASELEFFIYDTSYRDASTSGFTNLDRAGWYIEDYHLLQGARVEPYVGAARRALKASEIPVENSKGEAATGQHELNIRYSDALTMADRHVVMKHGMKELADAMGMSVTFMAKPHTGEAGNSCHVHLSLCDAETGQNVFDANGEHSDTFRWFLGGWMMHLPDLLVCAAPTVNSYKRFEHESWAPTRVAWSSDNRTTGFRIVGHGQSLRIECRIPGADCNPYLVYAAALASGIDGIENQIEPPAEFRGDAYSAADLPTLPSGLSQAAAQFRSSAMARAALGDEVVDHYAHFHDTEVAAFDAVVTDWERARYFERI